MLAYSWRRAGIAVPLTVLCAGGEPTMMIDAEVVVTANARNFDGGNYAPYNKPYSLFEWLGNRAWPPDETILLLDADMVVFDGLPEVQASSMQPVGEMYPSVPASLRDPLVRQLTDHPELLQPVGVPLWIGTEALFDISAQWILMIQKLRELQLPHDRWIAEMVGYSLAAADLGIYHNEVMLSCGPGLFHYYIGHCGLRWDKASYTPWEALPPVDQSAPRVVRAFGALLNEYAALRRGQGE